MSNKEGYRKAFGEALERQLRARQMRQTDLTEVINSTTGKSVSSQYINMLMNGKKTVSPQWADIIANALNLDNNGRQQLHAAAALDLGYSLPVPDLTKKG